jgi:hypothetical protein
MYIRGENFAISGHDLEYSISRGGQVKYTCAAAAFERGLDLKCRVKLVLHGLTTDPTKCKLDLPRLKHFLEYNFTTKSWALTFLIYSCYGNICII